MWLQATPVSDRKRSGKFWQAAVHPGPRPAGLEVGANRDPHRGSRGLLIAEPAEETQWVRSRRRITELDAIFGISVR